MAEGSAGAGPGSAGATSQGQAGSESSAPQTTSEAATTSEVTQSEDAKTEETKETVNKSEDESPEPEKKAEKKEKPEKETEEEAKEESKKEEKKHKYHDRLTKAYPDRKFESDGDYESALDEHLDSLEGYKDKATKLNQKLIALFDAEPQVSDLVRDMIDGATFRQALARHISPEELTAEEGDPDYEGYNKNKIAREEAASKRKELQAQREADLKASIETMQNFAKENNMDEAAAEKFYGRIDEMVGAITSGKISKEALIAMQRAFNYENDIAKAKEEAQTAAKNQKIVAQKEEPEKKGDGIPRINKNNTEEAKKAPADYMTALVNKEKERRTF
jgi:hypothetical protein